MHPAGPAPPPTSPPVRSDATGCPPLLCAPSPAPGRRRMETAEPPAAEGVSVNQAAPQRPITGRGSVGTWGAQSPRPGSLTGCVLGEWPGCGCGHAPCPLSLPCAPPASPSPTSCPSSCLHLMQTLAPPPLRGPPPASPHPRPSLPQSLLQRAPPLFYLFKNILYGCQRGRERNPSCTPRWGGARDLGLRP